MKMSEQAIGGYFGLELKKGIEYHKQALRLNSARNALALLLGSLRIVKIFIPLYTCSVVWDAVSRSGCEYEFYRLKSDLSPDFDFSNMKSGEWFLFTNYFGLCDSHLEQIRKKCPNVIADNSQAFFSRPLSSVPTFYSARKFFGVPDGAYLYPGAGLQISEKLPVTRYAMRSLHLLIRAEGFAEEGYSEFRKSEDALSKEPVSQMSDLSKSILEGIDYKFVKKKRMENYLILHEAFAGINQLSLAYKDLNGQIPLAYPLLYKDIELRRKLIQHRIYIPCYWDNVRSVAEETSLERKLADCLLALPVDQRYNAGHMRRIIEIVKKYVPQ